MKRFLLPATAVLIALSSAAACADTTTGTIKDIDQTGRTITLEDGKVFHVPVTFRWSTIRVGEKVAINYQIAAHLNNASTVSRAS